MLDVARVGEILICSVCAMLAGGEETLDVFIAELDFESAAGDVKTLHFDVDDPSHCLKVVEHGPAVDEECDGGFRVEAAQGVCD